MAQKQTYTVVEDGFLYGDYYRAGDSIDLYPEQAVHDLPPHGRMLRVKPAAKPVVSAAPAAAEPNRRPLTDGAKKRG